MDALAALRLQIEWGADEALADEPVGLMRLAPSPSPSPPRPAPATAQPTMRAAPAAPPGTPSSRAQKAAQGARTLEELQATLAASEGCALRSTAMNLVFADGNPEAGLMLVGDAPGPEDDRSGRPFTGPAGDYLDRMLASVSLDRSQALLTTLVPWRPPGGRRPTDSEIAFCLPFLLRHIALVRPRHLVLLGALTAKVLLGDARSRGRLPARANWVEIAVPDVGPIPALSMPTPGDAMRSPAARREAWAALLLLHRTIKSDGLTSV
jgi:uracil-DNA glycosylase family 4